MTVEPSSVLEFVDGPWCPAIDHLAAVPISSRVKLDSAVPGSTRRTASKTRSQVLPGDLTDLVLVGGSAERLVGNLVHLQTSVRVDE